MPLPVIVITNISTVVSDDQVKVAIAALQKQVSNDFKGFWDLDASLSFLDKTAALPKGWWQIVICDDPDQAGALGYHELSENGDPLGKVFARLDLQVGSSWTVTLSHELLEMLADPDINVCAEGADGKMYALEVCDPVEADNLGYDIDGVLLSDFVTPSWFQPSRQMSCYDFRLHVSGPARLAPGGYISVRDDQGNWTQINARGEFTSAFPSGSRRWRRNAMHHNAWRMSRRAA
jgi:hypothetical protein